MDQTEKLALSSRMQRELTGNILPWWMAHAVDRENGGFYGAVTNQNEIRNDVPRSVVLTARVLWAFSAAYRALKDPAYLEVARHAYIYLTTRFWDGEYGGVYWLLDPTGQPLDARKQSYGQGFAIYGLSEYALALREQGQAELSQAPLGKAIELFNALEVHACDPVHGGYVEARRRDWGQAEDLRLSEKEPNVVKSMNTMLHIVEPFTNLLRAWDAPEARAALDRSLRVFFDRIVDHSAWATRLFFDMDWTPRGDHVSFGHDIEASWLLLEAAEALGDTKLIAQAKDTAVRMARAATRALEPDGSLLYEADSKGWTITDKHWWAQAEAMVGFYNAAQVDPDPAEAEHFAQIACRLWSYIDAKVIDHTNGDWFKGLNREGVPLKNSFKAGPWDCPYHHVRACLEMTRRLKS